MPIRVTCKCGKRLLAKEESAGKQVKCPACGGPLVIPRPEGAPAPVVPVAPPSPIVRTGELLPLDLPTRGPANGVPCPSCGNSVPVGNAVCMTCGYNFQTGRMIPMRPVGGRGSDPGDPEIGFFQLGAGILFKPVSTMDSLLYHAGRPDLLWKILCFIGGSFFVTAFLLSRGPEVSFPVAFGHELVGFLASVGCLYLCGSLFGERSSFLGAIVGIGFVNAMIIVVGASLAVGFGMSMLAGETPGGVMVLVLLGFLLWTLFMHVLAIRGVFSCGTGMAIVISIAAGIAERYVGVFFSLK